MAIGLSFGHSIIEAHRASLWASADEGPRRFFAFSIQYD